MSTDRDFITLRRSVAVGTLATLGLLSSACSSTPASAVKSQGTSTTAKTTPSPTSSSTTSAPGTSSSVPGVTTVPTRALTSFAAPAGAALEAVRGSTSVVQLVAPTNLPGGLSATSVSKEGGYNVQLYQCGQVLGVNNVGIGKPPDCSGLAAVYGSFGGQPFPSTGTSILSNKPITALTDLVATTPTCGPGSHESTVSLGNGVLGMLTTSMGKVCDLRWTQRGWIIVVGQSGGTLAQVKPLASKLINTITAERLPAARGVVAVTDAGDGQHTMAYWVQDKSLYWVGSYHLASVALTLLGSVASASE
ncbi:MAG: hypothetical protein ACRDX8_05590 [Acidimicrobiales bacterium]